MRYGRGRKVPLLGREEIDRAALLEIAKAKHAGAQLRQPAFTPQCEAADLLRSLFFASRRDLLPIMPAVPLPIRPMLHLVNPVGLHRIPSPESLRERAGTSLFWRQSGLAMEVSWKLLVQFSASK